MSSVPDNTTTETNKNTQTEEGSTGKANGQFRSPQEFSVAIEDALKNLQSKIEDMTTTLNSKLGDMEAKMQLLEKSINEASPIINDAGSSVAPEADSEDPVVAES